MSERCGCRWAVASAWWRMQSLSKVSQHPTSLLTGVTSVLTELAMKQFSCAAWCISSSCSARGVRSPPQVIFGRSSTRVMAPGPHDFRLGVAIDLRRVNHPKAAKVTDLDSFKATFPKRLPPTQQSPDLNRGRLAPSRLLASRRLARRNCRRTYRPGACFCMPMPSSKR
jgi:hypothetical protein